ncbi:GntR family transcriptional regulator [Staphylococcus caledonicus]|uniref:GntR family transcriptional regulator n=1 Tax=Staphylococcus TaxID=1279 RepID=UPI0018E45D51|nr:MULTISPECIES: GntR family transcriptional regulator [Staphylococcus]MBI5972349.1 GntR family transcriptional regulator [Staphylococcus caledonicus]MCI2947198.1 GntR family transcriptional regulator [Staphylococcus sp. acrmy]
MTELNSVFKVKEYIFNQIKDNSLKPGDKLPSNLAIAREVNVKTDDVYDAIGQLITEQVLTDNFEEGPSVKTLHPFFYPLNKLFSISDMIKQAGYHSGTEYLSLEQQPASILDAKRLGIKDKQPITIIERLRTANHQPVMYCLDKIAEENLTCTDYQTSDGSMLNAIELNTGHKVASAETEVEAISYEPHISDILNASPHEGLMLLKVVHFDETGKPILYSLNYVKSSLVKFKLTRTKI